MNRNTTEPAFGAQEITTSDSVDLTVNSRGLWIGGSGNIKVTTEIGDTVTFVGVSGLIPLAVRRIWATGTTATDIVSLY